MNPDKKLLIPKFSLKNSQILKNNLPPKQIVLKPQLQTQNQIVKIVGDVKPDIQYLINEIQTENKQLWITKCYNTFKDWQTLKDANNENREIILKQSLQLVESNDYYIKIMAIKASLFGFMSLNLLEMLFGTRGAQKPTLRRPKSGSKNGEQLGSLIYQPQQVLAILQKAANLSNEKNFVNLLNENQMNFTIFKLLKLFSTLPKETQIIGQLLPYLTATFTILKNIANNQQEQLKILQPTFIQLIDSYLHTLTINEQNDRELINLYSIITACLRNLSNDQNSTDLFIQNGIIKKLVISMSDYSSNYELILNTLRIMSKMSLNRECCEYFLKNQLAMQNIANFFKIYKTNIYIIIRASFLLANMTTYFEGIRQMIFYEFKVFEDIYQCFDYYWNKEIKPQNSMSLEQFGQSHAAWDFQILSAEKDIDALIRMIRLIANLLTIEQIGNDIILNYSQIYKTIIGQLIKLLQKNNQITKQQELINCTLSCLSNLTFYEKQKLIVSDFEFKNIKLELINILGHFIVQNDDWEICCDGLRVLSNLSRQKELIKTIVKSRLVEGAIVLLDSNSREVVYYSLGVIMNIISTDQEFKYLSLLISLRQQEYITLIDQICQVVYDCTENENDIANLCLKCLVLLLDQKISPEYMNKIEKTVMHFGNVCDSVLKENGNFNIQNSRNLINKIINSIPEEQFACVYPNCGRRFKTDQELQIHITRRKHQV